YYHHSDKGEEHSAIEKLLKITSAGAITFAPSPAYAAEIIGGEGYERIDSTDTFPEIPQGRPSFIDLKKIFHVQFGCIIFNLEVEDRRMWNTYQCLDVFKRAAVFTQLDDQLDYIDKIIAKRKSNYLYLRDKFALDDIYPVAQESRIPVWFSFHHEFAERYARRLDDFEVDYIFDDSQKIIGLPVHQNLTEQHLDYMYGIFRGVLNLCSEWEHTDVYGDYKEK
ncbi:MAG: hypothetical protein ACOCX7_03825, partial [Bacteroidota bacterium]